jgi:hypothetical protein
MGQMHADKMNCAGGGGEFFQRGKIPNFIPTRKNVFINAWFRA